MSGDEWRSFVASNALHRHLIDFFVLLQSLKSTDRISCGVNGLSSLPALFQIINYGFGHVWDREQTRERLRTEHDRF